MASKDLKRDSHGIRLDDFTRMSNSGFGSKEVWWYEEPKGICIVNPDNQYFIRWKAIKDALKRKEAPC